MEKLEEKGATVSYNDPYIPVIRPSREFAKYAGRKSVPVAAGYDLILVATAHDEYRKMDLTVFKTPVVDTRHVAPDRDGIIFRA